MCSSFGNNSVACIGVLTFVGRKVGLWGAYWRGSGCSKAVWSVERWTDCTARGCNGYWQL